MLTKSAKLLVGAFNEENAAKVGAFTGIVKFREVPLRALIALLAAGQV